MIAVRAVAADDADRLRAFFARVPEGDRTFFREDVLAPGVVEQWSADRHARRLVAVDDGAVVGYGAVLPGIAWSSHVGEIRLVVSPDHRRRGLGRRLADAAVGEATGLGLTKLVVEVVAEQEATVAMFSAMGFEGEGLLRDHVRSQAGEMHDLLLLSRVVGGAGTAGGRGG